MSMRTTVLAIFGLIMATVVSARDVRAQMLADGSYQMTGNAAIDVGLTAVNALNKVIQEKHDFQKFYVNSGKLDKALEGRLQELRDAKQAIIEERKKQLDASEALRQEAKTADKKTAADLAKKAAALQQATKEIDKADKALDDAVKFGELMRKSIAAMAGKDEKQALADWNGGVRKNLENAQNKMRERLKTHATALTAAGVQIKKGSTGVKTESTGAFTAQVMALSGAKQTELWVNGKKLSVKDSVGIGKDGKLELRAVIVDPRRKQSREIKGTANIEVLKNTDHELSYKMKAGAGKQSDWKVVKEEYEWKSIEQQTQAQLGKTNRSSGSVAKNDVYEFVLPSGLATETLRGYVYSTIEWKGPATEQAQEGLQWEIKIFPSK